MLPGGCGMVTKCQQIWMNSGYDKIRQVAFHSRVLAHWPQTVERFERSQRVCAPCRKQIQSAATEVFGTSAKEH